jgi:hypothetical protein
MTLQEQAAVDKMSCRKTNARASHPNSSVPGHRIVFLMAMAAHREAADNRSGVVNVRPGLNQGSSGLEGGRKN